MSLIICTKKAKKHLLSPQVMKTILDRLLKHYVIKLGFSSLLKTENKNRKIFENLFKYSCNNSNTCFEYATNTLLF